MTTPMSVIAAPRLTHCDPDQATSRSPPLGEASARRRHEGRRASPESRTRAGNPRRSCESRRGTPAAEAIPNASARGRRRWPRQQQSPSLRGRLAAPAWSDPSRRSRRRRPGHRRRERRDGPTRPRPLGAYDHDRDRQHEQIRREHSKHRAKCARSPRHKRQRGDDRETEHHVGQADLGGLRSNPVVEVRRRKRRDQEHAGHD